MVLSTLRHSGFRGFNVLPRGLLSRTWKQTSTPRVHAPLVLDEGQEKKLTTIGRRCRMCPICVSWCSDSGVKYDVDLVHPLQRPPFPLITPQMPSRVRIYGLSHHQRWPDESKRALRRKVRRGVTAQEGGVHECVANGYSSQLDCRMEGRRWAGYGGTAAPPKEQKDR